MFLFQNKISKIDKKGLLIAFLIFANLSLPVFSQEFSCEKINEIDSIRAELSCLVDKNSAYYIKTKQKLDKLIQNQKLDYSFKNRFDDIQRLLNRQSYAAAIYELNELIINNYEASKCNEILGDITNAVKKAPRYVAAYYKEAIRLDNDNIAAKYKLAKLYLREKRNILGIECLKEVIEQTNDENILKEIQYIILNKITPQNRLEANNLYEALGWIYLKLDCDKEAYKSFERAIELNPDDIFLKYYLADLYYSKNQNNEAINLYTMIIDEEMNDSQIKLSKAQALQNNGDINSSYKQYLDILALNPESASAKYGIYKLYQSLSPEEILNKIYANKKNLVLNKEEYLKFAQLLKNKNDNKGALSFIEYSKKFDKKEEIKKEIKEQEKPQKPQLKEEIKKTEKQPQIKQEQKPVVKKEEAKKEEAKKEVKKQEQKPSVKPQIKKTEEKPALKIDRNSKKYLEFKKIVDKYLAIEPKDKLTYIAIANTYKLMGEFYLAIDYYNQALKLEPTDSDIQYNLGLTYMELNDFETSKLHLEKAINLNEENTKAQNLLSFVNQKLITTIINDAYTKYENNQLIPAFQTLENGIKKFPKTAQLYYYRALVFDKMNRNAAQIIDLQKAIELDPAYYMSYYQLGLAYEKIKDERSALVAYERFLSTEPDEKELIKEVQKKVEILSQKYY